MKEELQREREEGKSTAVQMEELAAECDQARAEASALAAQALTLKSEVDEAQEALELGRAEASANALMVKRQSEHVDALESRSAVCRSLSLSLIRAHMYICAIHVCV